MSPSAEVQVKSKHQISGNNFILRLTCDVSDRTCLWSGIWCFVNRFWSEPHHLHLPGSAPYMDSSHLLTIYGVTYVTGLTLCFLVSFRSLLVRNHVMLLQPPHGNSYSLIRMCYEWLHFCFFCLTPILFKSVLQYNKVVAGDLILSLSVVAQK